MSATTARHSRRRDCCTSSGNVLIGDEKPPLCGDLGVIAKELLEVLSLVDIIEYDVTLILAIGDDSIAPFAEAGPVDANAAANNVNGVKVRSRVNVFLASRARLKLRFGRCLAQKTLEALDMNGFDTTRHVDEVVVGVLGTIDGVGSFVRVSQLSVGTSGVLDDLDHDEVVLLERLAHSLGIEGLLDGGLGAFASLCALLDGNAEVGRDLRGKVRVRKVDLDKSRAKSMGEVCSRP